LATSNSSSALKGCVGVRCMRVRGVCMCACVRCMYVHGVSSHVCGVVGDVELLLLVERVFFVLARFARLLAVEGVRHRVRRRQPPPLVALVARLARPRPRRPLSSPLSPSPSFSPHTPRPPPPFSVSSSISICSASVHKCFSASPSSAFLLSVHIENSFSGAMSAFARVAHWLRCDADRTRLKAAMASPTLYVLVCFRAGIWAGTLFCSFSTLPLYKSVKRSSLAL
jgi:hypothetical protein